MLYTANQVAKKLFPNWIYDRFIGRFDSYGLRRYFHNASWALSAKVASMVISFFVTVFLVRYLGPENYGQLSYAVSFVGLFAILSSLGIDQILSRELLLHPDKRNVYLGSALGIKLIAGSITTGVVALSGYLFANNDVSRLIIFLLAPTYIFIAFQIIINEYNTQVMQKYTALVSLAVVVILNLLKVIVILTHQGVLFIGTILLLEPILYAVFLTHIRSKQFGALTAWYFDHKVARKLITLSWPFVFITVFTSIYTRIDQVMLKYLIDASAVGFYDAAVRVAEVWLFIPNIIVSSLFPAIMNAKKTSVHEYKTRLLLLAGLLIALCATVATSLMFIAPPLIKFLYGQAFAASTRPFVIYLWSGLFAALGALSSTFLIAENKRKLIFFSSASTAILNTVLNLILIPRLGIQGAAWSTLISYVVLSLPLLYVFKLKT